MSDNVWKMPPVHRGSIVLWYEGGTRNEDRACPAIVVKVQHASIALKVFGIDNDFRVESCRHMEDPNAKEYERTHEGGWDFPVSTAQQITR